MFACLCVLAGGEYFAISKWAIRHQTLNLFDATRHRPVSVDVAVRRDYEMKANNGFWKLPIAIISNATVEYTPAPPPSSATAIPSEIPSTLS